MAETLVKLGEAAVRRSGRFNLVLNGGGTPGTLFSLLAEPPERDHAFWHRTNLYWGDERCVPPTEEGSNFKQAWEAFIQYLDIPSQQVFRIRGEMPPQEAARDTIRVLARQAEQGNAWPAFDLVLLGMGSDGHTASLFPGADYAGEKQPAVAVRSEYGGRPADRVTLTPVVFNTASEVFFMAAGREKRKALEAALKGPHNPIRTPAQWIQPPNGRITWWLDGEISG